MWSSTCSILELYPGPLSWASLVAQLVKNLPAMQTIPQALEYNGCCAAFGWNALCVLIKYICSKVSSKDCVSLSISCLYHLPIDRNVKVPHNYCVTVDFSFCVCSYLLDASLLGAYLQLLCILLGLTP